MNKVVSTTDQMPSCDHRRPALSLLRAVLVLRDGRALAVLSRDELLSAIKQEDSHA
jgi:hypothetical protein